MRSLIAFSFVFFAAAAGKWRLRRINVANICTSRINAAHFEAERRESGVGKNNTKIEWKKIFKKYQLLMSFQNGKTTLRK